jgi:imidazolonepropionase-like amidohydrolase
MKPAYPICVFLLVMSAAVISQGQASRGSMLIKNGTVLTVTKGTLENTDVLIRDGKIVQIAKNIPAPDGVSVVDATGLHIMPGIIDTHSHIALDAVNEPTNVVTAEVSMQDALNPASIAMYRALTGGVTSVQLLHGSANVIGGQSEIIKLRYGTFDPQELRMEGAPRTIKIALGENPTRVHGTNGGILPRTRMGVEFVIRKAFTEAKEYSQRWDTYNRDKLIKGFRGIPPAYSLRLETIAEILKGNVIVQCHSYRADEISMMMRVCKDFGVKRLVFQHANEGFKVAPEIAAQGAMASVFSDRWGFKFEVYYSTAYNAAILTRNGVVTSIGSDDPELIRHLYHEAAKTIKYGGLTNDEALALVTINPARQLGIDARVGSLEIGKDADIALFKGHPLSVYAIPVKTIVDGIVRFDREKDKDDMRLITDPDVVSEMPLMDQRRTYEDCLAGAELFFGFEN